MPTIFFRQNYYPASPFKLWEIGCNRTNQEILTFTELEDIRGLKDLNLMDMYGTYWIFSEN